MRTQTLLVLICIILGAQTFAQQKGTLKDARDETVYETVKIGNQVWMAENLNADRFRNGDPIQEATSSDKWKKAYQDGIPVWCYYDFDSKNGPIYGKLYNWHAVTDKRGLAPAGWHIPGGQEVKIFEETIEMAPLNGFDFSERWERLGFTIQYSGNCTPEGTFNNLESHVCWWTTDKDQTNSWSKFGIGMYSGYDSPSEKGKMFGFPVRCIKN